MGHRPLLVGVTGGLGSGKSTLCGHLQRLGCALFEADRVAKELQLSDPAVVAGISAIFGRTVYSQAPDASLLLDRREVARQAFSSPEKLSALNDLLHPKVHAAFQEAVRGAEAEGTRILLIEAAILLQSDRYRDLDAVVVVVAPLELRVVRAVAKGMGSEEEVRRRIAAQWSEERLVALADYVVPNDADEEALALEAERLFRQLLARADSAGNGG